MKIVCIVPTIREEQYARFETCWKPLFDRYDVKVVKVIDSDTPTVDQFTVSGVMGQYEDLIFNKSDVVRNLGFIYAKKVYDPDIYLTLDDDCLPIEDSIKGHIDVLGKAFPLSWMSTASEYVRGVPYGVRNEGICTVSHGVWEHIYDYDSPTQLIRGNPPLTFYTGAIPRGVYFPFCGMNVAFTKEMLKFMYWAPMGPKIGLDRFGDIWLGIVLKRICDAHNWVIATGYSHIWHDKASNVFTNLVKEARGIGLNETFWNDTQTDEYFSMYEEKRKRWEECVCSL